MVRRQILVLLLIVVTLVAVSCKKMEEASKPTGPLAFEAAKYTDAIPQDYGNLVAVTVNTTNAWAGLWFQKTDGTVTLVPVNVQTGKLGDKFLKIPRK